MAKCYVKALLEVEVCRKAGASQSFLPQASGPSTSHYHMLATAHATDAFELTINHAGTLHELLLHLYMHSPYRP